MSIYIVNAAPMVIQYGTQDLSTRQLPREPEQIPQHLPKFYLYAQKGPTTPQLVVGAERITMFGQDTFDLRSKYANHATVYANLINAEGNSCMIERIIPEDAGPQANLALWMDVLPTKVDLYERNPSDGSIKLNALGNPIVTGQADGYKIKWVTSFHDSLDDLNSGFGKLTVQPGDQYDADTDTQSQRYPILEIKSANIGDYGNLCGFRMWAPTLKNTTAIPTRMMATNRAYPFFVSMLRRPDANSTPRVVETVFAEQATMFTLKQNVIDPSTDKQLYIGNVFIDSYRNITDMRYAPIYGDFSDLIVYQGNIDHLVEQFHAAEIPFIDSWSDFNSSPDDKYLFNIFSGQSSNGVEYHSFQFVDDANSVRISEFSNFMAKGGSDGTMNDDLFAHLVGNKLEEYLDQNSELQEPAVNVESIFYDSGFPLETKYKIANFIGLRKDTFVVMSTHDVNDRVKTASEEHSIAVALRTRLQMFPESDYFGTPVMRGMIVGRSARLRNSQYPKHLPLSAEIAIKSARYMGSGQGRWKNGYHFDGAPGHIIDNMYDINITWVPASVRNRAWDVGLNWVQAYDRRSYFFPALKTVYSDDTSVLNSYFTAMAICELNKVAQSAWREFSGTSNLTNAQLAERVNNFVIRRTTGRFDERFKIVPETFFTDLDLLRGYSWSLRVSIFAPNLKTLMLSHIVAHRLDNT
jgi:hypothetical protein